MATSWSKPKETKMQSVCLTDNKNKGSARKSTPRETSTLKLIENPTKPSKNKGKQSKTTETQGPWTDPRWSCHKGTTVTRPPIIGSRKGADTSELGPDLEGLGRGADRGRFEPPQIICHSAKKGTSDRVPEFVGYKWPSGAPGAGQIPAPGPPKGHLSTTLVPHELRYQFLRYRYGLPRKVLWDKTLQFVRFWA